MHIDNSAGPASGAGVITSGPGVGQEIKVSKDTVLQIRAAFLDAAHQLSRAATTAEPQLHVGPPGTDPTSEALAANLNWLFWEDPTASYVARVRDIAKSYEDAAENCASIARQYWYTEEEIAASFQRTQVGDD